MEEECELNFARDFMNSGDEASAKLNEKSCNQKIEKTNSRFFRVNAGDYSIRSDLLPTPKELGESFGLAKRIEKDNGAEMWYYHPGTQSSFTMSITEVIPHKFAKTIFEEKRAAYKDFFIDTDECFQHDRGPPKAFYAQLVEQVGPLGISMRCLYDNFIVHVTYTKKTIRNADDELILSPEAKDFREPLEYLEITKNKIKKMKPQ